MDKNSNNVTTTNIVGKKSNNYRASWQNCPNDYYVFCICTMYIYDWYFRYDTTTNYIYIYVYVCVQVK